MHDNQLNKFILDRPGQDAGCEGAKSRGGKLLRERPVLRPSRYYNFGTYLKNRFGCKVYKVTLHAGFTCPNRDGRLGVGGCSYCINESFSPNAKQEQVPIGIQMRKGIDFCRAQYRAEKFIAYFQTFTNTYADVQTLKKRYDEALSVSDEIVGISIGTRPDCVPDEVLDLAESYTGRYEVWLEYGLQSMHDETLMRINRCHGLDAYMDAVNRTRGRNIRVCVHVILGLPGENWRRMMQTADFLCEFGGLDSLKVHHLYVARNTMMADDYDRGLVKTLSLEDYITLVCDFLERVDPRISLQRLVGDITSPLLIAPVWHVGKNRVFRMIAEEFARRGTCQGARCDEHRLVYPDLHSGRELVNHIINKPEYSR